METIERIQAIIDRDDGELDLAEAALWIARADRPGLNVGRYLSRLARHAEAAGAHLSGSVRSGDLVFAINEYLYDRKGFGGDFVDFFDPRNSLLNHVIDRRQGIPLTLSVVYITLGRCLGLPLQGVAFPGYFMVMLQGRGEDVVLDPYDGGAIMHEEDLDSILLQVHGEQASRNAADYVRPADKRDIVLRILHSLHTAYRRHRQHEKALKPLEMILALDPLNTKAMRDRARLFEKLDCHPAAVADYKRYLELAPQAADADKIKHRVSSLKRIPVQIH